MSTRPDPSSVANAEARAEAARAGLATTLNQLRENLKPANVAEEVLANAKATASTVTGQVWDVARRNPVPALLIGAGAAMLLGLGQRMAGPYEGAADDDRDDGEAERSPREAGPDPAPKLGEKQPLLMAALGVAVGAALGAALPKTVPDTGTLRGRFGTLRAAAKRLMQGRVGDLQAPPTQAVEDVGLPAAAHGAAADAVRPEGEGARQREPGI